MLWKRPLLWAIIGAIALISAVAPLFATSDCNVDGGWPLSPKGKISPRSYVTGNYASTRAPRIGQHFLGTFVVAIFFAILVDPQGRYTRNIVAHIWIGRYAMAVGACYLALQVNIWLFAVCPGNGSHVTTFWGLAYFVFFFSAAMSNFITFYLMVLRLRNAEHEAALRALLLLRCMLGPLGVACCIVVLAFIGLSQRFISLFVFLTAFVFLTLLQLFGWTAARAFWHSARIMQKVDGEPAAAAATWMRVTAGFVVAAVVTTTMLAACFLINHYTRASKIHKPQYVAHLSFEIVFAVDFASNMFSNLLCAGLLGPEQGVEAAAAFVGMERRAHQIRAKLLDASRAKTGRACTLANMMDGKGPDTLLSEAVARFRCISWDVLEKRPDIILQPTNLDGTTAPADLYALSEPCDLADCDVFLSHSWHDDAQQKWNALSKWCEDFKLKHCRSPRLWLDKVCINQASIAEDLQCLPIFLAACNGFLIISGPTYTFRLWCVVELFVYLYMLDEDDTRHIPTVITLGQRRNSRGKSIHAWWQFDVALCTCVDPEDKVRIMRVVDSYPGGIQGFNKRVRCLAFELFDSLLNASSSEAMAPTLPFSQLIEHDATTQIIGVQEHQNDATSSQAGFFVELWTGDHTIIGL